MTAPEIFVEDVACALRAAGELHDVVAQPEPVVGSQAEADAHENQAAVGHVVSTIRAINAADRWLIVASLALRAAADVAVPLGVPVFPLLRVALEHAAATAWVMVPGVERRVRERRVAVMELRGAEEETKFNSALNGRTGVLYAQARRNLDQLRAQLSAEFGDVKLSPASVGGVAVPRPTELVEHLGTRFGAKDFWRGSYDVLCSLGTHPGYSVERYLLPDRVSVPASDMAGLAICPVAALAVALDGYAAYMGWDRSAISAFYDAYEEVLHLPGSPA